MQAATPQLKHIGDRADVPAAYRDSAIADLLAYHNLQAPHRDYAQAELVIGMCMDHRNRLRIPDDFAYVMRAAGANFRGLEFQIAFAVAVGGARAIAVIGHDDCGMSLLAARRDAFVTGLGVAGWDRGAAERYFDEHLPRFEIGDPVAFVRAQVRHLRERFPRLPVAPLLYRVGDRMLYLIDESDGPRA